MNLVALADLRSDHLTLRPPQMADAPAVFNYASDPVVTRFLAWPRHTSLADSEEFIVKAIAGWQDGNNLVWLIEVDGDVVGAIGARIRAVNAGIGYVLAQACWGRGYASEALQLLSQALARQNPQPVLWAMCVKENTASARVLEKSGFGVAQTLARYFSSPNGDAGLKDVVVYRRSLARPQEGPAERRNGE